MNSRTNRLKRARRQQGLTLVELLTSIVIMGIVSAMILTVWFALQRSYAYSINSDNQQGIARDAMARMQREVRDAACQPDILANGAQSYYPFTDAAINLATGARLDFTTPFNDPVAQILDVSYQYVQTSSTSGTLYRYRAIDPSASIDVNDIYAAKMTLATNVMNYSQGNNVPIFTYSYIDASGNVQTTTSLGTVSQMQQILSVQIHLLIDTNPGHAPTYMDLMTTVQPRNMRQN
jgi:prepilin-type N-terminal cleavage/methylation domain-containing protein